MSMVISFESIPVEIAGTVISRPIIPVHLLHRTDEDYLVAQSLWVDSGADFTLLSGTIARQLDLDVSDDTSPVGGIGKDYVVRRSLCDVILARGTPSWGGSACSTGSTSSSASGTGASSSTRSIPLWRGSHFRGSCGRDEVGPGS